jgi:hypothetical protein
VLASQASTSAQTTSAVFENIFSTGRLRHQLLIQSQGAEGGMLAFSCRPDDTGALGATVLLNKPGRGATTQTVDASRGDGVRKSFEMMPIETFLATNGGAARDLFLWLFDGPSVVMQQRNGGSAAFDFADIAADVERFRPLCELGQRQQ